MKKRGWFYVAYFMYTNRTRALSMGSSAAEREWFWIPVPVRDGIRIPLRIAS